MSTHLRKPSEAPHHGCEVVGDELRARSPLALPTHRCVKCGSTKRGGTVRTDLISYVNPFVWLTLLISGLITIIAYLMMRKRIEVQYYLCPKCAANRKIGRITTSLVGGISIVGLLLSAAGGPFEMFMVAFLVAVVARFFWGRAPLRAAGHDDGVFVLEGASEDFVASLEDTRRRRIR